jgi:hypothetical protein
MLGHASAALTLDVNPRLFSADLDAVRDRLDMASRAADVPSPCPSDTVLPFTQRETRLTWCFTV